MEQMVDQVRLRDSMNLYAADKLLEAAEKILETIDPVLVNEFIRAADGEVVPARARVHAISISNEEYLALHEAAESYRRGRKR